MSLNVAFSNIVQTRRVEYTCTTGVTAGRWEILAIPQATAILPYGNLVMVDGTTSLTLTNCKAETQELVWGIHGPVLQITGFDRRVYWHGKAVDGRYNVRGADGSIVSGTERTPQQLATILWSAMGEPSASVTALPNTDRPEVNWDCDEAAAELEDLCERYGCAPTLNIASNLAGIVVKGIGSPLPGGPDTRWTQILTNGVLPTRLEACSGHVVIQSKLKLEPILRDTDGKWYSADDVSYAPDDGWEGNVSKPDDPLQPGDAKYTELNAELAKDLWQVWRVTGFADGTLTFGSFGSVNSVEDLLPISDETLTGYHEDDGEIGTDAYLIGTAAIDHDVDEPVENTPEGTTIEVPFTVTGSTGIIKTTVPIPKRNSDLELAPADLWIVCTHKFRDVNTGQYARYVRFLAPGGLGGVDTARRPDVIPQLTGVYGEGASHTNLTGINDNTNAVASLLDGELQFLLAKKAPRDAAIREFNGIQAIAPDGVINTVRFILDSQPTSGDRNCVTTVWYNLEGGPIVYQRERRRQQLAVYLDSDRGRSQVRRRHQTRRRIR